MYFKGHLNAPKSKQKLNDNKLSDKVKSLISFIIEEKLVVSDKVSHMIDGLYKCYIRNEYNKISLQENVQDIPKDENALKSEVENYYSKLLASDGIVFLNILSEIIVSKDLSQVKGYIDGKSKLSPIIIMMNECRGTKIGKAITLLEKLYNSEIIYELFDR